MAKRTGKRPVKKASGRKKSAPNAVRYFSDELGALTADSARAVANGARSKELKGIGHDLVEDVRAAGKGLAEALEATRKSGDAKKIKAQTRKIFSSLKKRKDDSWVRQSAGLFEDLLELGKNAVRGVADAAESDRMRAIPGAAVKRARAAGRRLERAVRAARASQSVSAMKKQSRKLLSIGGKEVRSAMRTTGEALKNAKNKARGTIKKGRSG